MPISGSTYLAISAEWTRFFAAYPNLHIGLLAICPLDRTGAGATEIEDTNYARQPVPSVAWQIYAANGTAQLVETVEFPQLADNQIIVGWALWDSAAGGNLLKFYCDSVALSVLAGARLRFLAGDVLLSKNNCA